MCLLGKLTRATVRERFVLTGLGLLRRTHGGAARGIGLFRGIRVPKCRSTLQGVGQFVRSRRGLSGSSRGVLGSVRRGEGRTRT